MTHGTAAGAAPDEGAALAVFTCAACGETKPASEFGMDKSRPNGLRAACRPCTAVRNKAWRDQPANKERRRATTQAWRQQIKMEALRHYGGICSCCGEADIRFLTFDHVDGGGSQHRAEVGPHIYVWLRNNGYPPGFQILCWNCNSGRQFNGGVCPHQDPSGRVTC